MGHAATGGRAQTKVSARRTDPWQGPRRADQGARAIRHFASAHDRHHSVSIHHRFILAARKRSSTLGGRQMAWRAYILYFELLVHTVHRGRFLAMAGGPMLHFGPRLAEGLRLTRSSLGISKRVSGVDCNGSETAAEPTLVSRRNNNPLSLAGRLLVPGLLAVFGLIPWDCIQRCWLIVPFARVGGRGIPVHGTPGRRRLVNCGRGRIALNGEMSGDSESTAIGWAQGIFRGRGERRVVNAAPWKRNEERHPFDRRTTRRLKERLRIR